jgi:hypothetical protein
MLIVEVGFVILTRGNRALILSLPDHTRQADRNSFKSLPHFHMQTLPASHLLTTIKPSPGTESTLGYSFFTLLDDICECIQQFQPPFWVMLSANGDKDIVNL